MREPLMWRMPSWEESLADLREAGDALGIGLPELREMYDESVLATLDDATWSRLGNSDSWGLPPGEHRRARRLARASGPDMAGTRDAIFSGGTVPAPVVLLREGRRPHLVAGDASLVACRAGGRRPAVLMLDARPRASAFRRRLR